MMEISKWNGRKRVTIEKVQPEIDGGRYPIKRVVGESVRVKADIFCDGHDSIRAVLYYKQTTEPTWHPVEMHYGVNDRWHAQFPITQLAPYEYKISAWVDHFKTWRNDLWKKWNANQAEDIDLRMGVQWLEPIAARAEGVDKQRIQAAIDRLRSSASLAERIQAAMEPDLEICVNRYPDYTQASEYEKTLQVAVDREKARFSAWYEMFPRSAAQQPGKHGTFADVERRLPYIQEMGFDVLYLPPIHPIGTTHRKGKNNSTTAAKEDVGSPWAIGSEAGGHKSIHPKLGTVADFRRLVQKAKEHDIEIALDIAFQCSPDHPYAKEHPEWFLQRPDGSIQYAENPPKKYEDIYPFNFDTPAWKELWEELKSVFEYWIDQGIRIFRVDNPHTKPLVFWEWVIGELKSHYPDLIFLSEAFTRPKIMYNLAKRGFTQSYTYYAWRNTPWELEHYVNDITQTDVQEYFRPNFWPNTPDILPEFLQTGGRPAFVTRFILAATLTANYGIYGPAFELCASRNLRPESEEYWDSEKYQIREWDLERPDSLREIIAAVNAIRKQNPALQQNKNIRFFHSTNHFLLCFAKYTEDLSNVVLVIANLDPYHTQSGFLDVPVKELGLDVEDTYQVHDLFSEARYMWHGPSNYIELNPFVVPVHILRLKRKVRTERDFDYFM